MENIYESEPYDIDLNPSDEEVREYALFIGLDLDQDPDLSYIAREGLIAPLPNNWKLYRNKYDKEDYFFFNLKTGESLRDHPLDQYYINLVKEKLKEKNAKASNKGKNEEKDNPIKIHSVQPQNEKEDIFLISDDDSDSFTSKNKKDDDDDFILPEFPELKQKSSIIINFAALKPPTKSDTINSSEPLLPSKLTNMSSTSSQNQISKELDKPKIDSPPLFDSLDIDDDDYEDQSISSNEHSTVLNEKKPSNAKESKKKTDSINSDSNKTSLSANKSLPDFKKIKSVKEKSDKEIQSLKNENESLHQKNVELEKKLKRMNEKVKKLEEENKHITSENKVLKKFLYSLKEKHTSLCFFDLNEYKVETVIGKGATSSVKIVHKTTKEKYAQKILKDLTIESFKRFLSECEILFLLRHPCIIRVYGFNNGDEDHSPSMILSLEPISLDQAIKDKVLDNHQKNRITVELVLGMRYIHKKNFMHRDLKPLNILLSKNKHVRISDFGLAKEENLETSQSKGIGTLRFMAPELLEMNEDEDGNNLSSRYTNKVDVYSFGITLIYIITEKYPAFNMKNVINGVAPKLGSNIVDWARELISRCLSHSPENRPSFSEIFKVLKSHNYDLFSNDKGGKMTTNQQTLKNEIENRILKIKAFEFQHCD